MNPTAKIIHLFVFCGSFLGTRASLQAALEIPSMDNTLTIHLTSEDVSLQDIQFFLFTNNNPNTSQQIFYNNKAILQESFFNISQPLKVAIHGWQNNHSSPACVLVRQGFLDHGNFNVIEVDWGKIAMNKNYLYAASRVRAVGAFVGALIDFLVDEGSDPRTISVVGHSLGAHVAGLAALQAYANISHVVGLDPAGPGFRLMGPEGRISTSDADYVEIVHTCGGNLGLYRPLGHADFYPNGGGPTQPGCGADAVGACAHGRAYRYYAESLSDPQNWYAIMCNTSQAFEAGECNGNVIASFPRWNADFHKLPGIYQLRTASTAPYGLGINGTQPVKTMVPKLIPTSGSTVKKPL